MAKRPVPYSDDEDDGQEAGPSSRPSKRRQSGGSRMPEEVTDNADDIDMGDVDADAESDVDALDELSAQTQADIRAELESQVGLQGSVAEAGVVSKVEVENFMCHDYVEISLGPQINFITGENGSGKSAVLTALTVALGAKAGATGRGTGVKSFIKQGREDCTVTVHLRNKGPEAYRHDIYGDSIIIVRKVGQKTSSYKIQTSKAKTVSTKKEELDKIMDHMNIQMDNPINVLSQDAARAFLVKSDAKMKYDFFLKGTSLSQLAAEYDLLKVNIGAINSALAQQTESMGEMRDGVKVAKERAAAGHAIKAQEAKLIAIDAELAWSSVFAKEDEVVAAQIKLAEIEKKKVKTEKKIEQARQDHQEKVQHSAELEAAEDAADDNGGAARAEVAEIDADLRRHRTKRAQVSDERKDMIDSQNVRKGDMEELQRQLAVEQTKLNRNIGAEELERDNNIAAAEQAMATCDVQLPLIQTRLIEKEAEKAVQNEATIALENKIDAVNQELASATERQRRANHAQTAGPMGAYGSNIPVVLDAIRRQRWEGQVPIGPLGLYVKLKDQRWKPLVEAAIGNFMFNFAVTNAQDRNRLKNLLRDLQRTSRVTFNVREPQIIIFTPDPTMDPSGGDISRRPNGPPTLLSVLSIDDVNVRNLLVDRVHAERQVLCQTLGDAQQLSRQSMDQRDQDATFLSLDPLYKVFKKLGTESANYVEPWKGGASLFAVDHSVDIRRTAQEVYEINQRHHGLLQQRRQLADMSKGLNQEIRQLNIEISRLANLRLKCVRDIELLRTSVREEEPTNIAALTEALREYQADYDTAQGQLNEVQETLARIQGDDAPLLARRAVLQTVISSGETRRKRRQLEIENAAVQAVQAERAVEHYLHALPGVEREIAAAQVAFNVVSEEALDWATQAAAIFEEGRPPSVRDKKVLEKEKANTKRAIDHHTRLHGMSAQDAQAKYDQAEKEYQEAKQDLHDMKKLRDDLVNSLNIRSEKWRQFRSYLSMRAKTLFTQYLAKRGFLGKLLFDHNDGKLSLRVETDDLQAGRGTNKEKAPNQLSGGEKSFSTCCLLLSLWDAVGCPIRCLDEFDVYMDSLVRRQTMTMITEVAKSADSTQFIFISPQNMDGVTTSSSVRVIKMHPPDRIGKQSRLNFEPVQNDNDDDE